jgi:hypothetical protein
LIGVADGGGVLVAVGGMGVLVAVGGTGVGVAPQFVGCVPVPLSVMDEIDAEPEYDAELCTLELS